MTTARIIRIRATRDALLRRYAAERAARHPRRADRLIRDMVAATVKLLKMECKAS